MDPQIKKEWVSALRSGKYEQGFGCLYDSGKYCCLGVLCDILANHGYGAWSEDDFCGFSFVSGERTDDLSDSGVPSTIRDKIGLDDDFHYKLIRLNDDRDKALDEISDVIEREV